MASKVRQIKLEDELYDEIRRYAKRNHMTRSEAVSELLEVALKDEAGVLQLKQNLRRAYSLLDKIMDDIQKSGYRHR